MAEVSGTVRSSDGVLNRRLVRVYRQDTGALIDQEFSNEADGTWVLDTGSYSGHVFAVAHDVYNVDPYFGSTILAMGFRGSYLTDEATGLPTITAYGAPAYTEDLYRFGNGEALFDGIDDYFTGSADAIFSLGDTFTIEVSINPLNMPTNVCRLVLLGSSGTATALTLYIKSTGEVGLTVPNGGATAIESGAGEIATSAWHDIEVCCQSGTANIYVNAVLVAGPTAITTQTSGTPTFRLGYDTTGGFDSKYDGYLNDLRITKGINRRPIKSYAKTIGMALSAFTATAQNAAIFDNVTPA